MLQPITTNGDWVKPSDAILGDEATAGILPFDASLARLAFGFRLSVAKPKRGDGVERGHGANILDTFTLKAEADARLSLSPAWTNAKYYCSFSDMLCGFSGHCF